MTTLVLPDDTERVRRALLDAKAEAERVGRAHPVDLDAFANALEHREQAWVAWQAAAAEAGIDPYGPVPGWLPYVLNTTVVTLGGADAREWLAAAPGEGWASVDHSDVPLVPRGLLLPALGWDVEHGGGVFFRRSEGEATLNALCVWSADGRGGIRQEIAVEETACGPHRVLPPVRCGMGGVTSLAVAVPRIERAKLEAARRDAPPPARIAVRQLDDAVGACEDAHLVGRLCADVALIAAVRSAVEEARAVLRAAGMEPDEPRSLRRGMRIVYLLDSLWRLQAQLFDVLVPARRRMADSHDVTVTELPTVRRVHAPNPTPELTRFPADTRLVHGQIILVPWCHVGTQLAAVNHHDVESGDVIVWRWRQEAARWRHCIDIVSFAEVLQVMDAIVRMRDIAGGPMDPMPASALAEKSTCDAIAKRERRRIYEQRRRGAA